VRPTDVADETFFTHELTSADVARLKRALLGSSRGGFAWQPKRVRQVPLTEAIVELVRAGLGVSVVGRWAIEPQLRAGGLVALRLGPRGVIRKWSALYRRADDHAALRAFIELLRQSHGPGRTPLAA
jgi:LysR family transcriptional regulator for metE and metH